MVYNCNECGSNFPKLSQLLQHRRTENHWRMFSCDTCGKTFNRKVNLDRHKKKHTITNNLHCTVCSQPFTRYDNLKRHQMEKHQMGGGLKRSAENDDIPIKRLKKNDDPKEFYNITKINEQRMEKFKRHPLLTK
ncbi:zinc finger and SCAN domain-containing protein 12-like [Mercenaria mercenaria]|uniref:zinc finger and SCAN domain-containing protein 12-like n=1 Tax=Mercenaria mercenaria TaxID=6596 RepID=UPI00234F0723|nr:zinc finger and SCAN domain-containing protein 12-like [Mercenaria mercenaria]